MTQIESLKAKIPGMDTKAKSRLRQNASSILSRNPGDANAREILEFLNAEEATQPRGDRYDVTGLLSWETYRSNQSVFRAFHEDDVVGRISMRANHSSTQKDVYTLEILGAPVEGAFHHIRDARYAGERVFAARQDRAQS